jgi:hypothetical protein
MIGVLISVLMMFSLRCWLRRCRPGLDRTPGFCSERDDLGVASHGRDAPVHVLDGSMKVCGHKLAYADHVVALWQLDDHLKASITLTGCK